MQENQKILGIDGCRFGWCVAVFSGKKILIELHEKLTTVFNDHGDTDRVFIDMPMGLSDSRFERKIDSKLRTLLSPFKHQSVFTPPCREALSAGSYREALDINRKVTGKGISIQSWNITPKICELDTLLQQQKGLRSIIFESHPETCFYFLNGRNPVTTNKKTIEGLHQRLKILQSYYIDVNSVFHQALNSFKRKEVLADDLIDALCLGVAATLSYPERLFLLEDEVKMDTSGIPIRIGYCDPFPE